MKSYGAAGGRKTRDRTDADTFNVLEYRPRQTAPLWQCLDICGDRAYDFKALPPSDCLPATCDLALPCLGGSQKAVNFSVPVFTACSERLNLLAGTEKTPAVSLSRRFALSLSLSLSPFRSLPFALSLSLSPFRSLPFALSLLSLSPFRSLAAFALFVSLSLSPFRSRRFALAVSLSPFRSRSFRSQRKPASRDRVNGDLFDVTNDVMLDIGAKTGFCVMDIRVYDELRAPDGRAGYTRGDQGISMGCADVYSSSLQCQWIDITDVPDGQYDVIVTVNPEGEIDKLDLTNNTASVRVNLAGDTVTVVGE